MVLPSCTVAPGLGTATIGPFKNLFGSIRNYELILNEQMDRHRHVYALDYRAVHQRTSLCADARLFLEGMLINGPDGY